MNKIIYIGKIVNTHGIKGELRIISDFEKKDRVFLPGSKILIGKEKREEVISAYRHHKNFEMVILKGYTNINEVLKYKGELVYVKREELNLASAEYLYEDLIGLDIYENKEKIGKGLNIVYNKSNTLLYVKAKKDFYIPINSFFIKKVDLRNQKLEVEHTKGLII